MASGFYDIFKRDEHGMPVWVDKAADLDTARARIIQLSNVAPGQYLVIHSRTGRVIAAGAVVTSSRTASRNDSGETLIG